LIISKNDGFARGNDLLKNSGMIIFYLCVAHTIIVVDSKKIIE